MIIRATIVLLLFLDVALCAVTFRVDWSNVTFVSRTTPTLQIVMNPLIVRESPIHENIWNNLRALNAEYVRFQTWHPYPKLSCPELSPPSGHSLCADVRETYAIQLNCNQYGNGGVIDKVEFASFGTAKGTCTSYSYSQCNAANTTAIITSACVGKSSCTVNASTAIFGDPCYNVVKRLSVQVTCNPPQLNTYWAFDYQNAVVEDFMAATAGHTRVLDFSTEPQWMYNLSSYDPPPHYPDNPYGEDSDYQAIGSQLLDPTCTQVGEYFGRYAAWYSAGGFTDEYGQAHVSPYYYDIQHWEVKNEMEHRMDVQTYTCIYDATVTAIRKMANPHHKIQFVGLADIQGHPMTDFPYFLNKSNHKSLDIPIDWISYHYYSLPPARVDENIYTTFYTDYDNFIINTILIVEKSRLLLSPTTKTDLDEIGVILPGDNDYPAPQPLPNIYWVACASAYAYLYARVSAIGIEVLGASQLVAYPYLENVLGGLDPNYASVAILNWTTGAGTARYYGLKLMIDHFHPGDQLVSTQVDAKSDVFGQAYVSARGEKRLLLVNRANSAEYVTVDGSDGAIAFFIDESTVESPARSQLISNTTILLPRYALAVIVFAPSHTSSAVSSHQTTQQIEFNEKVVVD